MSPSNWAHCPRCAARAAAKLETRRAEVDAAYGKVPVGEFDAMRAALAEAEARLPRSSKTFRESYEISGTETGTVTVTYGGSCEVCHLELRFDVEREIPGWNT